MSKELKPGDLALVVNSDIEENIGKVVTLLYCADTRLVFIRETGRFMRNFQRRLCWVVSGDLFGMSGKTGVVGPRTHAAFAASRLMPLKGDEQPAQVRRAERVQ